MQIVGWYDELLRLTGSPVVQLNRAVAIGEADGARAGLVALATVDPACLATPPYLHEKAGDLLTAARCTPTPPGPPPTSPNATTSPAARINQALRG